MDKGLITRVLLYLAVLVFGLFVCAAIPKYTVFLFFYALGMTSAWEDHYLILSLLLSMVAAMLLGGVIAFATLCTWGVFFTVRISTTLWYILRESKDA